MTARLRSRVAVGLAMVLALSLVPCLCLEATAGGGASEEHACCASPTGLSAAERDCCDASRHASPGSSLAPAAASDEAPVRRSATLIVACSLRPSPSVVAAPSPTLPLVLRI